MMSNQIRNRGRAYQCQKCPKVLRKARMISHILKHHISMDRIPYSCTLCLFRCQEQRTLIDHIYKYKRHTEAERKLGYKPNYTEILKRSANPYTIGDNDMRQMDKEDSYRWHGRSLGTEDPADDPFCDDDDDDTVMVGDLALPRWVVPDVPEPKEREPIYVPTPIQQLQQDSLVATGPIMKTPPHITEPVTTINIQDWQTTTIQPSLQLSSTATNAPSISYPPALHTPVIHIRSPTRAQQTPQTPCQDENILPGLLRRDELNTFLVEPPLPSPTRKEVQEKEEPPKKKPRIDENHQALGELTKAISAGFEKVVMAIDSNTRVLRNQGQTLEKVVGELSRIERKLNALERSRFTEKENIPPNRMTKSTNKRM